MEQCKKILIVDDEKHVLEAIKDILGNEGYMVLTARDGISGLVEIKTRKPDLVITDIIMLDMEGMEFIKTIRKEARGIPIIAMSGHLLGTKFLKATELMGAKASLLKPFSKSELLEVVERLLKD